MKFIRCMNEADRCLFTAPGVTNSDEEADQTIRTFSWMARGPGECGLRNVEDGAVACAG